MFLKFPFHKSRNYPAFTLIEMLVVIVIVGIIGAIAVGTYASSRKQATLELGIDGLISAFKEQSQKARGGSLIKFGNDLKSACFGLELKTGIAPAAEKSAVQYLTFPYAAVGAGEVDSCNTALLQSVPYNSFEDLEIKNITVNDDQSFGQLQVLYKPPFGKSVFKGNNAEIKNVTSLKIVIGLKNTQDKRCFSLDNRSGVFTVLPAENC